MYARVASAQDFHAYSHSHHSNSQRPRSHGGEIIIAQLGLSDLHEYALYIYARLRALEGWKEQFESLEVGVRLDVGVGKGKGEKRFFVNEITRFYGADYFSQHTLGAPQQEVCWAFAESVDGYFGGGGGEV